MLIDEADHYIYNDPPAFQRFIRKHCCVCLTGTCSDDENGGFERAVLKTMNFRVFENMYEDESMENLRPSFQKMGDMPADLLLKFLGEYSKKQAVLLYCSTEFKEQALKQFNFATLVDEGVSHAMLRSLDDAQDGQYQLLITDDPIVGLRGLDLRGHNNGVTFMTLRSFTNQREMQQAAMRVGRAGDQCKRIIIGDIALVDHMASCAYKKRLILFNEGAKEKSAIKMMKSVKENQKKPNPPSAQRKEAAKPGASKTSKMSTNQPSIYDLFNMVGRELKRQKVDEEQNQAVKKD